MRDAAVQGSSRPLRITLLAGAAGIVSALGMAVGATVVAPSTVEASVAFTQQTGIACAQCHTTPPQLTEYGKAFKAAGNQVPKQK